MRKKSTNLKFFAWKTRFFTTVTCSHNFSVNNQKKTPAKNRKPIQDWCLLPSHVPPTWPYVLI